MAISSRCSSSPGSLAEEAGLKKGQRIIAVNGRPIGMDYLDAGFRWRFVAPGTRGVLSDDLGRLYRIVLADCF